MSDAQDLGKKIQILVKTAFHEIVDIKNHDMVDAAHILMDSELQKRPLQFEHLVLRHVSLDNETITAITHDDESKTGQHDLKGEEMQDELIDSISKNVYVEAMPKINVEKKNLSYLDAIRLFHKAVSSFSRYCYDEPYLSLSNWSDAIFYRNRQDLVRPFEVSEGKKSVLGDAVIAEKEKRKNNFDYPRFNDYVSPSIIFQPYRTVGPKQDFSNLECGLKLINILYDEFQKL